MSENDDKRESDNRGHGSPPLSSDTGLRSKLKSLIKTVTPKPKPKLGNSYTSTVSLDDLSESTSGAPPLAVPVQPAVPVEQTPALDGSPVFPATQSHCESTNLEQSGAKFLAHMQGPSPMVVVPDSPYIKKRRSRSAIAAEPSKPEPEWHGMNLDDPSTQTSQQRLIEGRPSPDELRDLTTGKHKVLQEPQPPSPPVQSKVSRMTQERPFSERVKIFFVELAVTIKKLFNSQP